MPAFAQIFSWLAYMYWNEGKHHAPHFHLRHAGSEVVVFIDTGEIEPPSVISARQARAIQKWVSQNKEALLANWTRALEKEPLLAIAFDV